MAERLQKLLSARGLCSRREAEQWILQGRVQVNGVTAGLGDRADPEVDTITVDRRPLPAREEYVYLMLHKPRGVVTTLSDEKGRKNAAQLVRSCGVRVYPVGRLDMDSEGLLLFTNDGEFANALAHPKHEVEKTYYVWVSGYGPGAAQRLARPVAIDGYQIKPPRVKLLWENGEKAKFSVVIHEGRNRQVRKMCALAGMTVTKLMRVAEGQVKLGDLPAGQWRHLTEAERTALLHE